MVTSEIRSTVEAIEKDPALYREVNFEGRAEAIDSLEFIVIDRIDGLLQGTDPHGGLIPLKRRAEGVKRRLEYVDDALFRRVRVGIRSGACTGAAFERLVDEHVDRRSGRGRPRDGIGYDSLDLFVNGLLLARPAPAETGAREPEMVFYQRTPARIVFELAGRARLTSEDVFYDLGSGLGQVPILVNLLCGAATKGVEIEPAYCDYSRACAADLGLSRVEFIRADARTASYSDGTVFFMYTPFEGGVLREVLEALREEARRRRIRVFTYGPCTPEVSRRGWLRRVGGDGDGIHELCEFVSA